MLSTAVLFRDDSVVFEQLVNREYYRWTLRKDDSWSREAGRKLQTILYVPYGAWSFDVVYDYCNRGTILPLAYVGDRIGILTERTYRHYEWVIFDKDFDTMTVWDLSADGWSSTDIDLQPKLVAGDNITISGNTISADLSAADAFVAAYNVTTYAAVKEAYDAGRPCFAMNDGEGFYVLSSVTSSSFTFSCIRVYDNVMHSLTLSSNDSWSYLINKYQNELSFDTEPTKGSTKPVTSNGIFDAFTEHDSKLTYVDISSTTDTVDFNALPAKSLYIISTVLLRSSICLVEQWKHIL